MAMKASYIIYILFILLPNVVTMAQSVESDELFSKGVHLYNMKKYKEAIPIFQESDRLDKIEMDSTHNRRDYSAMWLASCHYQLGDEKQAQKISPYYYKLSPIDRRLTIQSDSLSALADKAFEHQDYTKALKLYKQCDAIEATILGKNHIWRMTTIANEGYCYSQLSDSTNAIKCFEAHQAACQQLYNLECDAAMNTLFALGHEYYNHQFENHYPKALNAYFQAYELAKNLNDSINYNSSLYCISLCYFSQSQENNGDEQGKYLENAEVFVRELRNDNEEDRYLKNLIYDNLANFYNKKSEEYLQDSITLQQALDYSQKALETYQKKPDADQGVKRLLEIYKMDCLIRSNKIQEAIELGEDLYAAFLPIRQQESENYQTLLQNLSYSYKVLGNEEKNIFYLNLLSTSYTQSNQTQNEKILDVFYELSQAYYRTSQYKEALHYAKTAKKICNREIYPKKYPYILFNLAQAYLENEQTNNSLACINEILSITQPDVDIYIHALRLKTSAYNYIDSSQALDACLQCIKPAKKLYGEHSSFYRALLYDIANLYYNLGDAFSALQYAEEEMRLNQQCADTLDIIYLRNQTTLANLYSHYDLGKSAAYFTSVVRKITHNEFLTEQHWTYLQWPMEERISELLFLIQVFNNIFDTITSLPDMENNPEYCTQMDSTRNEFLRLWNKREDIRTKAVLYGGLEYERGQGDIEAMRKELQSAESLIAFRDVPEIDSLVLRKGISFLEGTEREVQTIDTLLRNKQIPVALMSGMAGTEESFKQLSGQSITLLHVATHGFYSPLTGHYTAQRSFEEQALSRSGLFLSGAAASLNMKKIPEDIEDGILTAKELSKLDLSNLNLAILSACQTGLGEIVGDGVFGLQRGFKKAGAQTLLMSLWKVDDTATQLLMAEFYKNLVSGQNKRAAFLNAQKYLRSYQNGIYDKPEYWAAFIMLDGIH